MELLSQHGTDKNAENIKWQNDIRIIPDGYWDKNLYAENSEINLAQVDKTIDDIRFDYKKVMICGRATDSHPNFAPRFSTPSADIQSDLYVIVDHKKSYQNNISRGGNYALSLIVHPEVVKKIIEIGGKVYWFSPDYLKNDLPKIIQGKFPVGNSGLTAVSIAAYKDARSILLSGINLTNEYSVFMDGKELIFSYVKNKLAKIYSTDGILAERITYEDWLKL